MRRAAVRIVVPIAVMAGLAAACTRSPETEEPMSSTSPAPTTINVSTTAPTRSHGESIASLFAADATDAAEIEATAMGLPVGGLSDRLHAVVAFPPQEPGRTTVASPIGFNQRRQIVVRTPEGYDGSQRWPLIVMYHTWGGSGDLILDRLENLLGDAIENFVVAAPDDYRQTVIDAPPPVSSEHVAMWHTVRSRWHIDADRMYLAGYSLGGDTVVTLTAMHPGHLAGGLAMAAGLAFPTDVPNMVETFLPNLRRVPMLHVYGSEDSFNIVGLNFRPQDITLAQQNELLDELIVELGLDAYRHIRLEGVGHGGAYPTTAEALSVLDARRPALPDRFSHTFRYIHQADAYWIEGHEWDGDAWLAPWPEISARDGESEDDALNRTIFELLGTVEAQIDGQTITVETTHLSDLTVWLHEGMVDWNRPVTVVVNGSTVFTGRVEPSAAVALAQALRTFDFDRLRLAGIRVDTTTATATLVTPADEFPDIARGVTF